jgi:multimeric flavodoxin WrbA
MKVALINGSPKAKDSASGCILQEIRTLLPAGSQIMEYSFRKSQLGNDELEQIAQSDTLIISFPLYVDGIPSQLVSCLYQMEAFFKTRPEKKIIVYSIANCGFYEGQQNSIALEMIKNWCEKSGLKWGQGVGIGGGGMVPMLAGVPAGKGPKKNLSKALEALAENLSNGVTVDNIYVSPSFPRIAYKLAAEMGWRHMIKANGLNRKDLFIQK